MYLPSASFSDNCAGCGDVFARFAGKYPAVDLPVRRFLFTSSTSKILDSVLARKVLGLLIESWPFYAENDGVDVQQRSGRTLNTLQMKDLVFVNYIDSSRV